MCLCFLGGATKTMVVCCYCCKNIDKNICYEKNYYRQNRYNYYQNRNIRRNRNNVINNSQKQNGKVVYQNRLFQEK